MKYLVNNLTTNWKSFLDTEFENEYFQKIDLFLFENQAKIIFPHVKNIFKCFNYFNIEDTKIVIFGQDPYINENEATGLAFGIDKNLVKKIPPSLINIAKELKNELGIELTDYSLENWAKQGVLLLNTQLSVFQNKPNSHQNIGWEYFIQAVIKRLNEIKNPIIFLLMGKNAQALTNLIASHHYVITCVHPSPLSCYKGFWNSNIFIKINKLLKKPFNW